MEAIYVCENIMEAIHYFKVSTEVIPVHRAIPAIETATEVIPVTEAVPGPRAMSASC